MEKIGYTQLPLVLGSTILCLTKLTNVVLSTIDMIIYPC